MALEVKLEPLGKNVFVETKTFNHYVALMRTYDQAGWNIIGGSDPRVAWSMHKEYTCVGANPHDTETKKVGFIDKRKGPLGFQIISPIEFYNRQGISVGLRQRIKSLYEDN